MAEYLRRERVRYAMFPLLLLAIIVTGFQSSHHQFTDKPTNGASVAEAHNHPESAHHNAGDVDGHAAHLGADDAHGSHGPRDGGPLPACHELENPQATATGRCSLGGADQQLSPEASPVSWESAEHRPSACASRDVHWAPPPGPAQFTTLCVLRI